MFSPEYRRFRSRFEVKKYLDEYCLEGVSVEMFDFALGSKKRKGTTLVPKEQFEMEKPVLEEKHVIAEPEIETVDEKEEGRTT